MSTKPSCSAGLFYFKRVARDVAERTYLHAGTKGFVYRACKTFRAVVGSRADSEEVRHRLQKSRKARSRRHS